MTALENEIVTTHEYLDLDENSIEFLLLTNDPLEREHFKNVFLALAFWQFGETFEYFSGNEFTGSPIFDSTCEELVESLRQPKEEPVSQSGDEYRQKDKQFDEKINKAILMLLMSVYGELTYTVEYANYEDLDMRSYHDQRVKTLLDYSLFRDENQDIREKITKLSNLLSEPPIEPNQNFLLQLAHSELKQMIEFWNAPYVCQTFHSMVLSEITTRKTMKRKVTKRKTTQEKFGKLYKKHLKILKAEKAKEEAKKDAELVTKKTVTEYFREYRENRRKRLASQKSKIGAAA